MFREPGGGAREPEQGVDRWAENPQGVVLQKIRVTRDKLCGGQGVVMSSSNCVGGDENRTAQGCCFGCRGLNPFKSTSAKLVVVSSPPTRMAMVCLWPSLSLSLYVYPSLSLPLPINASTSGFEDFVVVCVCALSSTKLAQFIITKGDNRKLHKEDVHLLVCCRQCQRIHICKHVCVINIVINLSRFPLFGQSSHSQLDNNNSNKTENNKEKIVLSQFDVFCWCLGAPRESFVVSM